MTNTKQGQIQDFQRGGGTTSAKGASFVGGSGACPPEIFENLCLWNDHFQHFETNFVLI